MAARGDEVTLQIVGVNGAKHDGEVEGHNAKSTVKRGEVATVRFTAGDPGVYRIICSTHAPTMTGYLVVLPRK